MLDTTVDLARELDLETRYAGECAGGGADLGRKIRHRGQIVAERCCRRRELVTGELHAVTGIASEPDHDAIQLLDLGLFGESGATRSSKTASSTWWTSATGSTSSGTMVGSRPTWPA